MALGLLSKKPWHFAKTLSTESEVTRRLLGTTEARRAALEEALERALEIVASCRSAFPLAAQCPMQYGLPCVGGSSP